MSIPTLGKRFGKSSTTIALPDRDGSHGMQWIGWRIANPPAAPIDNRCYPASGAGQSSGAPALWTVAAQVLDRHSVSPRNVVRRNAKGGCEALALRRTGGVVAAHNGLNEFRIQSRGFDQFANADSGLFHEVGYSLHYGRHLSTFTIHLPTSPTRSSRRDGSGLFERFPPGTIVAGCSPLTPLSVPGLPCTGTNPPAHS